MVFISTYAFDLIIEYHTFIFSCCSLLIPLSLAESDGDSVIMIKEVASPQAQRNSLEERLKEHPLYDLDWVKSM